MSVSKNSTMRVVRNSSVIGRSFIGRRAAFQTSRVELRPISRVELRSGGVAGGLISSPHAEVGCAAKFRSRAALLHVEGDAVFGRQHRTVRGAKSRVGPTGVCGVMIARSLPSCPVRSLCHRPSHRPAMPADCAGGFCHARSKEEQPVASKARKRDSAAARLTIFIAAGKAPQSYAPSHRSRSAR